MDLFSVIRGGLPPLRLEKNFSLAEHTTLGCGGVADVAAYPSCGEETAALLRLLDRYGIPRFFLGAGANVLSDDGRFEGVVVLFSRMDRLSFREGRLLAGAGVGGGALLRACKGSGVGGFEPFAGIPMTVGGGIAMNAGVRDGHLGDRVRRVLAADGGKLRILSARDCAFGEKTSVFLGGIAVVCAEFSAEPAPRETIEAREKYYLSARSRLPKGRSMGCTFVNPEGISAGALIEACGLKGTRIGGAVVSERHANFILNEGASARDVARLIAHVKAVVSERTGIVLREEIRRFAFH